MSFVKSFEELSDQMAVESYDFHGAQMLTVFWETRPEIVEKLLPPPLEPADRPLAMAFVADYPDTNFGPPYKEGALFLWSTFQGQPGYYCLAMPVTGDLAMAGGREIYGFPKKIAKILFDRDEAIVAGFLARHGIPYFQVKATLDGRPNAADFPAIFAQAMAPNAECVTSYTFKYFTAPDGIGFDYEPRLVKTETIMRAEETAFGGAEVSLKPSPHDPWSEVEVVRLLGAVYTKGDNSLLRGQVVAEVDSMSFLPYAFTRWDG